MSIRSDATATTGNSPARSSSWTVARSTPYWRSRSENIQTGLGGSTFPAQPPRVRGGAFVPWCERCLLSPPGHYGERRLLQRGGLFNRHTPVFGGRASALHHHHATARDRLPRRHHQLGHH